MKKTEQRNTRIDQQARRARRIYASGVLVLVLCGALTCPAMAAASDPLTII